MTLIKTQLVYGLIWLAAVLLFINTQLPTVWSITWLRANLPLHQHLTNFYLSYVLMFGLGLALVKLHLHKLVPGLIICLIIANILAESLLRQSTTGDYIDSLFGLLGIGLAWLALKSYKKDDNFWGE